LAPIAEAMRFMAKIESKSLAVTTRARSACCSGEAKPPQTTSPSTSKITTSASSRRWCCLSSFTVWPTT
jgi:hypothetical protein